MCAKHTAALPPAYSRRAPDDSRTSWAQGFSRRLAIQLLELFDGMPTIDRPWPKTIESGLNAASVDTAARGNAGWQ